MTIEETPSAESETPTAETQDEMSSTPVTGETPEQQEPPTEATPSQSSADDLSKELESLRAALKKANKDAASSRHAEKELKALKDQIEAQTLSEQDKLQKKLADLQKTHDDAIRQAQEYKINTEVRLQASQSGFADPQDAVKFLDWSEIEYDDNGSPTNVTELIADLVKSKPYLLKPQGKATPTVSATNPSRSARTSDDAAEYVEKLRKGTLTSSEYNALPADTKQRILKAMH